MNKSIGTPRFKNSVVDSGDVVVRLNDAAEQASIARALRAEARSFEARNGKNPYSGYVLKHGRRPSPEETAAMARTMNLQLKASDGSVQPKRTRAQRASAKALRANQKANGDRHTQISKLICAIRDLTEITEVPDKLLNHLSSQFDEPVIFEKLETA